MADPMEDAVVDSLPDAVTKWTMTDNWRESARAFIRRLEGQGYRVVTIHDAEVAEGWKQRGRWGDG